MVQNVIAFTSDTNKIVTTCMNCGNARYTKETEFKMMSVNLTETIGIRVFAKCVNCNYLNKFIITYNTDTQAVLFMRDVGNQEPLKAFRNRLY